MKAGLGGHLQLSAPAVAPSARQLKSRRPGSASSAPGPPLPPAAFPLMGSRPTAGRPRPPSSEQTRPRRWSPQTSPVWITFTPCPPAPSGPGHPGPHLGKMLRGWVTPRGRKTSGSGVGHRLGPASVTVPSVSPRGAKGEGVREGAGAGAGAEGEDTSASTAL